MADIVTYRHYEQYLTVDTAGEMKLTKTAPRSLSSREVAYLIKVSVPITRIPMPAGTISLKLPELTTADITVEMEERPVANGLMRKHLFSRAELSRGLCARCGIGELNPVHQCSSPDCKRQATMEIAEVPFCGQDGHLKLETKDG